MPWKKILIPVSIVLLITAIVSSAARRPFDHVENNPTPADAPHVLDTVMLVDRALEKIRNEPFDSKTEKDLQHLTVIVAKPAEELQILRRLSLSLHGTVPSLQEIRQFQADTGERRLERWTMRYLNDRRYADYMAERLARAFVGKDGGQFLVYRRDRFVEWLREQLHNNRPYDELVREVIASEGLWTGTPATNFVTAAVANNKLDRNKLAARTVRAFLGQRIDCAQCHDHPWTEVKQSDFEGLAAHYGQTNFSAFGVEDIAYKNDKEVEYEIEDRETLETRVVPLKVPFNPEWITSGGSRRDQLAEWVTHPENRRFERAIANRMWAVMFGKPYFQNVDIDDLPDPPEQFDVLDYLGADFRAHGYDLKRLILVITSLEVYRQDYEPRLELNEKELAAYEKRWAVFPTTRLRPEQVIGSMIQAASIKTIDQNSHLLTRIIRLTRESDFVKQYGDLGDDEFIERAGTIAQALLRMNGKLTREMTEANFLNASNRLLQYSRDEKSCIENSFLVCYTRMPTEAEMAFCMKLLDEESSEQGRKAVMQDIFWSLFNAPEFSWNH